MEKICSRDSRTLAELPLSKQEIEFADYMSKICPLRCGRDTEALGTCEIVTSSEDDLDDGEYCIDFVVCGRSVDLRILFAKSVVSNQSEPLFLQ